MNSINVGFNYIEISCDSFLFPGETTVKQENGNQEKGSRFYFHDLVLASPRPSPGEREKYGDNTRF